MTLFHFAKTLEAIKSGVSRCPSLRANVDHTCLREARRKFKPDFPAFEPVRHAVAHSGELLKDQKTRERNLFSGEYIGNGITLNVYQALFYEILENRKFTTTHDGKLASFEVSWKNWQNLDELSANTLSAFEKCR